MYLKTPQKSAHTYELKWFDINAAILINILNDKLSSSVPLCIHPVLTSDLMTLTCICCWKVDQLQALLG